jgi:hypothetical protein
MANTAIRALTAFSDGVISMYEGEVRSVDSTKASAFVAAGLATENTTAVLPSGSTTFTANGTYDVYDKETAIINVSIATVTYNVNGGEGEVVAATAIAGNTITLDDGTGITPPTDKEFKGWATTDDAEAADVTSPYTVTADVTLYAVYGATE